jgi:hypothetical protein
MTELPALSHDCSTNTRFTFAKLSRFLLTSTGGAFLTPLRSHYDIAFACVAYLVQCTDLIDGNDRISDALLNVVEGFHSLQLYANAFWSDHFLEFIASSSDTATLGSDIIMEQLQALQLIHKRHSALLPNSAQTVVSAETSLIVDIRLEFLTKWKDIHSFLQQIVNHRRDLTSLQEKSTSKSMSQNTLTDLDYFLASRDIDDLSMFGQMLRNYKTYHKQILNSATIPGIRSETLKDYKRCNLAISFLCDYHGCKWGTEGFASATDLSKHRAIHGPSFVCTVSTCQYSNIGFRTSNGLRQHRQKYHATTINAVVPRTIRRTKRNADLLSSTNPVHEGMTNEEVIELLGSPSQSSRADTDEDGERRPFVRRGKRMLEDALQSRDVEPTRQRARLNEASAESIQDTSRDAEMTEQESAAEASMSTLPSQASALSLQSASLTSHRSQMVDTRETSQHERATRRTNIDQESGDDENYDDQRDEPHDLGAVEKTVEVSSHEPVARRMEVDENYDTDDDEDDKQSPPSMTKAGPDIPAYVPSSRGLEIAGNREDGIDPPENNGKNNEIDADIERTSMWETMPQLLPTQQVYADSGAVDILKTRVSAPERIRSGTRSQRQGATSSYWSVVEEHDFRKCLEYFGTDFQAIANHMGSKTQTMVGASITKGI